MNGSRTRRSSAAQSEDRLRCAWLNGELLLVSGLEPAEEWSAVARTAEGEVNLESAGVSYSKPEDGARGIVLLRFFGLGRQSAPDAIVLTAGGTETTLDRDALGAAEVSAEQLISDELAGGDVRSRGALLERLAAVALPALGNPGAFTLARRLRALRDALREPLPPLEPGPDAPQGASVELIMGVDERSFWVVGWVRDIDRTLRSLIAVTPEGQHIDLLENAYRHVRRDVQESYGDDPGPGAKYGFVTYLRPPHASLLETGWLVELHRTDGSAAVLQTPAVIRDPDRVRIRVLDEFAVERAGREQLRVDHAHPALVRLQERRRELVEVEELVQYGSPPEEPVVSVVIPLYERIDLVEHQLAHFGRDPQLANADLIYVLDSPALGPELGPLAAELHALHRVPFRVVTLARNAGFAAVNNVGASHARGRLILLMNSDVIPAQAGWLERMAAFYDSTPEIGALGPKLLYEDLSIQHAGMFFRRETRSRLWGNMHYFKGLHRDFADACISRPVPAVTGACMMVARDLWEELGGLSDLYVQGGYEDSDICIRLAEAGRRNWYLAEEELYHLEAQSFPSAERQLITLYNTWLQTHLWDEQIERMMAGQQAAELSSSGGIEIPSRLSSVG